VSVTKEKYHKEGKPVLMKRFGYRNIMEITKMVKIVINEGIGDATQNQHFLDLAVDELTAITGQKPVITRARKSISNFKLRKGNPIGCKVTLRGQRMLSFWTVSSISQLQEFETFEVSDGCFDGRGLYFGIREQLIFPK
jgi:large subunit ribosomal protein L5